MPNKGPLGPPLASGPERSVEARHGCLQFPGNELDALEATWIARTFMCGLGTVAGERGICPLSRQ